MNNYRQSYAEFKESMQNQKIMMEIKLKEEINLDNLFSLIIVKLVYLESRYNERIFYDNKNNYQMPSLFGNKNLVITNINAYQLKQEIIKKPYNKMAAYDLEKRNNRLYK